MKHHPVILLVAIGLTVGATGIAAPSRTPPAPKAMASPGEGLAFSGAVAGSWSHTGVRQCDFKTGQARAAFVGTLSGTAWTLSLEIRSYKGPGTYDSKIARTTAVDLDDGNHNPNTYFSSTDGAAQITVAAGGKSGTLEALLQSDTGRRVRVSGSWRC